MDKETLFKLIRQQEVVLWAGSGFSKYAGYEMGAGVVKKLHDSLSQPLRDRLKAELGDQDPLKMSLPDFAQLFVTLHKGNRFELNRVVTDEFSKVPKERYVHEQLARIPYIKHIITTNYDKLFELTYESLNVVYNSNKLPLLKANQPTLYKIHGHLDDTDSLVITRGDYQRFFGKADPLLWKHLESLMASRTFVFVGYAVEDPNVMEVFLRVREALGNHMRPAFVVSPSMSPLRRESLERDNIHYIEATGEEFVAELLADIKKNALREVTRDEIDLKTTLQLLTKQGLSYLYNGSEAGVNITDLRRKEGQTTGQLQFSAPIDSALMQGLAKLSAGESLEVLKMSPDELTAFSLHVEGFELPLGEELSNLWIARTPTWHKQVAIRFASGLLLPDVRVKLYTSRHELQFVAVDRYARAVITMPNPVEQLARLDEALQSASEEELRTGRASLDLTLSYSKRRPGFDSVEAALAFVETMLHLGRGGALEVLENWAPIFRYPPQPPHPSLLASGEGLRELLLGLQKVEKCFGIRFQHFNLEGQDLMELRVLVALIDGDTVEETGRQTLQAPWNGNPEEKQKLLSAPVGESQMEVSAQSKPWTFDVLGFALQLTFLEEVTMMEVAVVEVAPDLIEFSSQKLTRQATAIIEAKVLASPPPAPPAEPTPADLLDDMLPEDLLPGAQ